ELFPEIRGDGSRRSRTQYQIDPDSRARMRYAPQLLRSDNGSRFGEPPAMTSRRHRQLRRRQLRRTWARSCSGPCHTRRPKTFDPASREASKALSTCEIALRILGADPNSDAIRTQTARAIPKPSNVSLTARY